MGLCMTETYYPQSDKYEWVLTEFEKYAAKYVSSRYANRQDLIHEILVQALFELNRLPDLNKNELLKTLKIRYINLFKRARSELRKYDSFYYGTCDIIDLNLVSADDLQILLGEIWDGLLESLTNKQREVLYELIKNSEGKEYIWKDLGYSDASGYHKIVNRIRKKVCELFDND
jgi:hypothetical protein